MRCNGARFIKMRCNRVRLNRMRCSASFSRMRRYKGRRSKVKCRYLAYLTFFMCFFPPR